MSARLKRLEGMVREMMDTEASAEAAAEASAPKPGNQDDAAPEGPAVRGRVVRGENATTYVGATHCMAMLEDVSECQDIWYAFYVSRLLTTSRLRT